MKLPRFTRPPQKKPWLIAAGVMIVIGFFVFAHPALAQSTNFGDDLSNSISGFLARIVITILQAVAFLTEMFIHILIIISQFNQFTTVPIVKTGWALIKDLSNMVFIVALLVIAVGTILRLENYRYNRLLGRVVVMAFLVNFSMLIAGFFIQAGQVVMLTFVNAFKDAAFGNFASMFGLDKVLQITTTGGASIIDLPAIVVSLIAGLAMMVVAMVVMMAICVVLAVRVIALWILIILSPMAFALRIIPNTEKYYSQWWGEFTKYVTVGPVLAFFLWMALALHSGAGSILDDSSTAADLTKPYEQSSGYVENFKTLNLSLSVFTSFFISIIFLVMGLQYATKSGTAGAAFASKVASTGFGVGFAPARMALNAVRDRTIAPVQGWINNRQQAARARVAERTLTLEGAGARVRAAIPTVPIPGTRNAQREGQERAAANARQVERQQAGAFAAQRGVKDMSDERVQQMFQKGNRRERLVGMEELKNRKKLDLGDVDQRKAFDRNMDDQRLPPAERKRLTEEVMSANVKSAKEEQLRKDARIDPLGDTEQKKAVRIKAIEELDRRQLLNLSDKRPGFGGEDGENQRLYKQLGDDVSTSPEVYRQFRENMMRNNQDMAMKLLFGNLEDQTGVNSYKEALQQKQISTSTLNKGLHDRLSARKADGARIGSEIFNHLKDVSPDEETFRSYFNGINKEAAHLWSGHLNMDGENHDRRVMAAKVTGEWGKAFTERGQWLKAQENGQVKLDDKGQEVSAAQEAFDKIGGAETSRNLTHDALRDKNVLKMMKKSANFKWPHWEALRNRDEETRTALGVGLQAYADDLAVADASKGGKGGKMLFDNDATREEKNKENSFVAQQLFLARKGKFDKGQVNPYDLADETKGGGLEKFTDTVRGAKATDLSELDKSDEYKDKAFKAVVDATVGENAALGELADLVLMNKQFAENAIQAGQRALEAKGKSGQNRLRLIARHPVLQKFLVDYSPVQADEEEEDEGPGGAGGPSGPGGGGGGGPAGGSGGTGGRGAPNRPRTPPSGGGSARDEAARSRPARRGSPIVLPPGVDLNRPEPEPRRETPGFSRPLNESTGSTSGMSAGSPPITVLPQTPGLRRGYAESFIPDEENTLIATDLKGEDRVEAIREKYLSYQDAAYADTIKKQMLRSSATLPNTNKYARGLLDLEQKHGAEAVLNARDQLQSGLQQTMQELAVPISTPGQSQSWAMWDLGKQYHYQTHPSDRDPKYTVANPLLSKEKLTEILDRHIGWEAYAAAKKGIPIAEKAQGRPEQNQVKKYLGQEPNAAGTLSSKDLADLGRILRTVLTSVKELKLPLEPQP